MRQRLITVLAALAAIAAGVLLLARLQGAKEHARSITCGSQLTSIGSASRLFSDDNKRLGRNFNEMSNELIVARILICPADKQRLTDSHLAKIQGPVGFTLPATNYTFQWMAMGEPDTNANKVVVRCPIHNFLVRADGSVRDTNGNPRGKSAN